MGKQSVHAEVLEVLPWFVNESLGEKERQLVLGHLRECPECRAERDELQAIQQVVAEDDGTGDGNYKSSFRKLMTRIETAEANRASIRDFEVAPENGRESGKWWLALSAAACLFVAVVITVGTNPLREGLPEALLEESAGDGLGFRTLSDPGKAVAGIPHRMALTFEQPVMAETLRAALIETRSNIVSGPDKDGTYIVEVAVPPHMTDAEFINSMRAIDGVQYAAFYGDTDLHR